MILLYAGTVFSFFWKKPCMIETLRKMVIVTKSFDGIPLRNS